MSEKEEKVPEQSKVISAPEAVKAPVELTQQEQLKQGLARNQEVRQRIINVRASKILDCDSKNDRLLLETLRDADNSMLEQMKINQQDDANETNKQLAADFGQMVRMSTGNPHAVGNGHVIEGRVEKYEPDHTKLPSPEILPGVTSTHSEETDDYNTFKTRAADLNLDDADEEFED